LLWTAPAASRLTFEPAGIDPQYVYIVQGGTCLNDDPGPKYDGGIWRVERASGAAKRILRTGYAISGPMLVESETLWFEEVASYCQRFQADHDQTWIANISINGGAKHRVSTGHQGASLLSSRDGSLVYLTAVNDKAVVNVLDERSGRTTPIASGVPFVSALVGNSFYFIGDNLSIWTDVWRVSRAGGDAERVEGDGIARAALAKPLGLTVTRGAMVYATRIDNGLATLQATDLATATEWDLAPLHGVHAETVGDDLGVYWIDKVAEGSTTVGVYGCTPGPGE
jgi:hypothetical protein